jgi:hypothetical protein
MHYLRTDAQSLLDTLQLVVPSLDTCWWYLGGSGFSITSRFKSRHRTMNWTDADLRQYWQQLLQEYVQETPFGRVGKPGFLQQLGDSVDSEWRSFFAIESADLPTESVKGVAELYHQHFGAFDGLPPGVLAVICDVDHAYKEYGFRDQWMFDTVFKDLTHRKRHVSEITSWPQTEQK